MSFFIRKRKTNQITAKRSKQDNPDKKYKPSGKAKAKLSEEISSDDDSDVESAAEISDAEEPLSLQEKKIQDVKSYLTELAEDVGIEDDTEDFRDRINQRLEDDQALKAGTLQRTIAAQLKSVKLLHKFRGHRLSPTCVCISPDGQFVFSGSKDGSVIKYNVKEGRASGRIRLLDNKKPVCVFAIALSSDGKFLACSGSDKSLRVLNPETLEVIKCFSGHRGPITALAFQLESHILYSASDDKSLKVWSLDEMGYVETLFGHHSRIYDLDALLKERALSCGGQDRTLRLWKIPEESQLLFNAPSSSSSIESASLINEEHFVSGHDDGSLALWSILKKKPSCVLKNAHSGFTVANTPKWVTRVKAARFTDLIASGSYDGMLRFFQCSQDYRELSEITSIAVPGFINDLSFSADAQTLACSVGQEHRFGRWLKLKEAKNSLLIFSLEFSQ